MGTVFLEIVDVWQVSFWRDATVELEKLAQLLKKGFVNAIWIVDGDFR